MLFKKLLGLTTALSLVAVSGAAAESLTIATVNNGDMIRMQGADRRLYKENRSHR